MIPTDHFHNNGDGTAWLVTANGFARVGYEDNDRPCDTCGGKQSVRTKCGSECDNGVHEQGRCQGSWSKPCPDCINGRHTFTVEVDDDPHEGCFCAYRVSVIPGMVLLIESSPLARVPMVTLPNGSVVSNDLPSAAKPNMWALKLRIHND